MEKLTSETSGDVGVGRGCVASGSDVGVGVDGAASVCSGIAVSVAAGLSVGAVTASVGCGVAAGDSLLVFVKARYPTRMADQIATTTMITATWRRT